MKAPKLDLDRTRERLARLGLPHAGEQLDSALSAAVKGSLTLEAIAAERPSI